ncbi:MAG: cytochrome-c peroxidase [Flavobacterium sp. BFFFF1]|uniref:cytochrome-c peroxidase n=1 Tax=Flavobacterium sp. BFFFF1 TaxID=2015557 RepID=UPI000BD5E8D6|nr:cytochrome c peroxidase [Flavobacterium sp. BFFFF1]OYU79642.1 MAG: cytochrome-c peroxidase [Flavobacterium sp. BFFFF1]
MKIKYFLWLLLPLILACSNQEDDSEYVNVPIDVAVPSNFPAMAYDIALNPPTQKGFELGKKLFYDGRLSSDGLVSCAFCHVQEYAFTHHGHTVSHGVDNQSGTRNAPSIQNLAYQKAFMWDGATTHLDLQPVIPLTSPIEMNGDLNQIVAMMNGDVSYRTLYKQAFRDGAINSENMLKALAQFMVAITSSNSKFDKYRRNEPGGTLTPQELAGYSLFTAKCSACHATDLMTDDSFRNNGLAINPLVNDVGRYRVTLQPADLYKFKVPSLRNVEKSAPYMHDGRFGTLETVLNHYASGVTDSATLDPVLKQGGAIGIPLTANEKQQLIAFLKTLTDNQFLTDTRFSEF